MSKTVFILGAGASREAGAPLMFDFLDTAENIMKRGLLCGNDKKHFLSCEQGVHREAGPF